MPRSGKTVFFILLAGFCFGFRQSQRFDVAFISNDQRLLAATWFGLSAESKACYLQTYQMAELALLSQIKALKKSEKKPAIVTDLDETALDNSAWAFKVMLEKTDYPQYWENWEKAANAPALPGAVSFFKLAASQNIAVFYISNRAQNNLKQTIENLNKLGFPYADSNHVFLKTKESNKVARREMVLKKHQIIMLLGDNLADFDGVWEHQKTEKREEAVYAHKADWGRKFIIFPNPVYGGWKDALMEHKKNVTISESDSIWAFRLEDYLKRAGF